MSIYTVLTIFHIIGTAIGVGGATFSDMLFFRVIKDGYIDKDEYDLLSSAGKLVILGICLLVLSGIGFLLIYQASSIPISEKILAKLTIVAVIAINGIYMHKKIFPLLKEHSVTNIHVTELPLLNKHAAIITAGVISATSWYTALILGAWRDLSATYIQIFGVYLAVLIVGILFAQKVGAHLVKRFKIR